MPDDQRGPAVPDEEHAYRAILYPWQWAHELDRPSTAAFDEPVFSVDIASRTTPQESAARFNFILKLVQFNCGNARQLGFDTRDEPDPRFPENDAHAHVYFDEYQGSSKNTRKKRIRRLIEFCTTLEL